LFVVFGHVSSSLRLLGGNPERRMGERRLFSLPPWILALREWGVAFSLSGFVGVGFV
jgi:hypothetical protein